MKTLKLSFLLAVLMSMVCTKALAKDYDAKIDGIYYKFNISAKTAEVTSKVHNTAKNANAYSGSITIPQSVTYQGTNYSVTAIGEGAFAYCSGLTSITIPNSVTSIGALFRSIPVHFEESWDGSLISLVDQRTVP